MQSDKYTIAWFKIAECVSRGEKERALGVYRLLSHSFNDDAVARQLEADIHLSCNEQDKAVEFYRVAIELYNKAHRFMEAIAILEHLVTLLPRDILLRYELIGHYGRVHNFNQVCHTITVLLNDYSNSSTSDTIEKLLVLCGKAPDTFTQVKMLEQLIVSLYSLKQYASSVLPCLEKALNICTQRGYEDHIQDFCSVLRAVDEELYDYACMYIKQYS